MPLATPRAEPRIPDEADIVAKTRAGSQAALALVYEEHAERMLAVAYRLLGSRDDAEDVALARLRETNARPAVDLDEAHVVAPTRSSDASLTLERALRDLSPSLRVVL